MKLEHQFEVPAGPDEALDTMLDAERVVPCMPGATLEEVVDERHWKAAMAVKLGPVSMQFAADVSIEGLDREAKTARLNFRGRDKRGKGGAQGTVDARFVAIETGTRVEMDTDVKFSGQAAQLGRPSLVKDVSERMVGQFADCLAAQLSGDEALAAAARERSGQPISGSAVIGATIKGAAGRLLGRHDKNEEGGSS